MSAPAGVKFEGGAYFSHKRSSRRTKRGGLQNRHCSFAIVARTALIESPSYTDPAMNCNALGLMLFVFSQYRRCCDRKLRSTGQGRMALCRRGRLRSAQM